MDVEAPAPAPAVAALAAIVGDSEISPQDIIYERKIGEGNYGVVYEGQCQRKQVAIKDIRCDLTPEKLAEVRSEIKIDLSLRHPNVVLTMGACTTVPGKITIVSELMKTDLKKLIIDGDGGGVSLIKRIRMSRDAAAGILWLHTRNPPIIHRDIKMENFLVSENGDVKVCDFGLSQVRDAPYLVDERNHARGTPIWMPPEVLSGKPLTEKADVYSFGLFLWSMVTCKEHSTHINTFRQLCESVLGGIRPNIPSGTHPRLARLIQACWNGDQRERPDFQTIVDELDNTIHELEIPSVGARNWWLETFGGAAARVPWSQFVNDFCHKFAIVADSLTVEDVMASQAAQCVTVTRYLRCFQALITDKESGEVVAEKFGEAVAWLGDIPQHARRIIVVAAKILGQRYFFGDITKEESEMLLSGNLPGTFLVRFSTTSLGGYTVSRVTDSSTISHTRLRHPCGSMEYSHGRAVARSLPDLIEAIKDSLDLEFPCPGWPFSYLFNDTVRSEGDGYVDNDDNYDDVDDDDDDMA